MISACIAPLPACSGRVFGFDLCRDLLLSAVSREMSQEQRHAPVRKDVCSRNGGHTVPDTIGLTEYYAGPAADIFCPEQEKYHEI